MNAVSEVARPKGGEIVALVEANPVMVLTDAKKFSDFYNAMKAECDAHVPDLSTEKGRKAIGSLAYKVARTKTAIDDAGKKLNEEARARINAIDESRREIRQQLDDLKDEVRRPLTEWEEAEKRREEQAHSELTRIREMGRVAFDDTAETVAARLAELDALTIDEALHGFRAELERLRAEAVERERLEAERKAAEEAERRRAEAEKAEQDRIAALEREAEERARIEAERVAREEREAADRAHAEELAAERRRAEEAERAAQAERDRAAREDAERKAAAEREAAALAAREADRAHRSKIMGAAKEGIMEAGPVDEAVAKAIVLAIAAGGVPNVSIRF